jgi:hypothetical protein
MPRSICGSAVARKQVRLLREWKQMLVLRGWKQQQLLLVDASKAEAAVGQCTPCLPRTCWRTTSRPRIASSDHVEPCRRPDDPFPNTDVVSAPSSPPTPLPPSQLLPPPPPLLPLTARSWSAEREEGGERPAHPPHLSLLISPPLAARSWSASGTSTAGASSASGSRSVSLRRSLPCMCSHTAAYIVHP